MQAHGNLRPMPDGFAQVAYEYGLKQLARQFNAGQVVIIRWRNELGSADPRKISDDPPTDLKQLIGKLNKTQLQKHYGVGESRLNKWLKAAGISSVPRLYPHRRIVPADFAEVAPTMPQTALARHYKADWTTIKRWCDEAGVSPAVPDFSWNVNRSPIRSVRNMTWKAPVVRYDARQITMYDEAADTLRRERFVVFRCGPTGKYLEKGLHWRVGNVVCTPDELLQRAAKYKARAA